MMLFVQAKACMRTAGKSAVAAFLIIAAVSAAEAPRAVKHRFLAIDEGLGNLLYVNELDSSADWIVPIKKTKPRDMQLIGNNRLLVGHEKGFVELDISNGEVKRDVPVAGAEVTSVRRRPDGNTLVMGIDLDGSKGVVLLELDSLNVKKRKIVYPDTYVRLMRQTPQNTYLFTCDDTLREGDPDGTIVWKIHLPGSAHGSMHSWKAVRLPSGNTLVSTGYGGYVAEFDAKGSIVRKFGQAPQPAGVNPKFYAMFQLLPGGNCVVANWQGHGPGHGNAGIGLLEFDPSGAIVWQWNKAAVISSLQGILVLDSLNTALLHDERGGIMEPLTQVTSAAPRPSPRHGDSFRVRSVHGAMEVIAAHESWFHADVMDLSGRIVARFPGQGRGRFDPGTGMFLLRIMTDDGKQRSVYSWIGR